MDRELTESERIEREEFSRGHIGPDEEPVEPRPAATMVLARRGPAGPDDGEERLQLLFLRRPDEARFAAGAYVFPGGVIDPEDEDPSLLERFGPGAPAEERVALVAALRELFEETGLLPADRLPDPDRLEEGRYALLAGRASFVELARRWELSFRQLRAVYFARWVTPPKLSRRYDARFFLAEHAGGEPDLVHEEHTEWLWLDPETALARFEAGDLPLLYPTRKTTETLADFDRLESVLRAFRERRVTAVRPRLLVEGEAVIPVLPGDPRYEEAG